MFSNFDINFIIFGILPYAALTILVVGSIARYDRDQYTWKSSSSQLLKRKQLIWGSILFHVGIITIFFGHLVGLFTPVWVLDALGVPYSLKQWMAVIIGGPAGIAALIGASLLMHRRLTEPRIRATSSRMDITIMALIWLQLAIGLLTILLILAFDRTRLRNFSMLLGMVIASGAVVVLGWEAVDQVGKIPAGLPLPALPDLSLLPELIAPAISIAIIGLVQGAGVSKAYPNPDGNYPDISRDFSGQGASNLAAGIFQGMPLGGSVASTALNVSAGARSRWANVFAGLVVVVVVLLFSRAVSLVAMPAMAALLIVAGIQSIKREEFLDVWDIGWGPRLVMMVTLALTLTLPVQYAVLAGVVLSVLVYLVSSAQDVRLMEIVPNPNGTYREQPVPAELPSNAVTILHAYGNLFYAAAYKLEDLLPSATGAERPVVILRLRRSDRITSTLINVLEHYEEQLQARGGKLMLAGISPLVKEQLDVTETTRDVLGDEDIFLATENIGEATHLALEAAQAWLEQDASLPN